MKDVDEEKYLDPVFLAYGQRVFSYEYIELLRDYNLKRKRQGKIVYEQCPQKGFQERVLEAGADVVIAGGRKGGGKATSVDSMIVTPAGYRRLGDLKVGDAVTDPVTGGTEHVTAIYEHPGHDLFEVTFEDGCTCECGLEHLWNVRRTGEEGYRTWTFAMIKERLDARDGAGVEIPLCAPAMFTVTPDMKNVRPDFDPYVIGALLGGGSLISRTGVSLTSGGEEVAEQFAKAGFDMRRAGKGEGGAVRRVPYRLIGPALAELCLLDKGEKEKFIPWIYKWGAVEDRWSVLQGLMDTGGHVGADGICTFTAAGGRLAEDVRFIVRSLGGKAALSEGKEGFTVRISIPRMRRLFRVQGRREACGTLDGDGMARRITGYRYVGRKDARCIAVDGDDSLYMLQDFIVTHNTWIALYKALYYSFNPDVSMYAFRKYEDDIKRGPWKASQSLFRGFGTPKPSSFEWAFIGGTGATMKMEHLQDLGKITDRFRGAEMAYIDLEELPEHTRENVDIIFDFLSVNRNTAGEKSQIVCTCNPVGWSNRLRKFLEWYIDPQTDTVIPERDGKVRYMFNYGSDIGSIAWGDSWEEVYANPKAKEKIDLLLTGNDELTPRDMILTLQFIEGDYADNKILQVTDKRYVSRLAAKGGGAVVNDMRGIWRDIDSGTSLLSMEDMEAFFTNTERRDGVMRASADVALTGDFFVIWAFDGHHVCDLEAWLGAPTDEIIPFTRKFLRKNGVREENFTYDANGLGLWFKDEFKQSTGFNNKSAPSDNRLWNNLKSESADKFVHAMKNREFSIDEHLLSRTFTDKKKNVFSVRNRLMDERLALKRKDNLARFEIIDKPQMKLEVGHSPDFIEALFMVMPLIAHTKQRMRKGFENMV